jgi:hypothetical protein
MPFDDVGREPFDDPDFERRLAAVVRFLLANDWFRQQLLVAARQVVGDHLDADP